MEDDDEEDDEEEGEAKDNGGEMADCPTEMIFSLAQGSDGSRDDRLPLVLLL